MAVQGEGGDYRRSAPGDWGLSAVVAVVYFNYINSKKLKTEFHTFQNSYIICIKINKFGYLYSYLAREYVIC